MQHPDYNSPPALRAFMEQGTLAMQKRFGQNFMVTESSRRNIVSRLEAAEGDLVWEVGPGLGSMTELLLETGANVTAFEIDRAFASLIPQFFDAAVGEGRLSVVEGDVLKTWRAQKPGTERGGRLFLFGNLPYNIAATFIADTITAGALFDRVVVTVQKEVAQRMAAKPGTGQYSAFSVLCQWMYSVRIFMELPPAAFWPKPSVASAAVVMEPLRREEDCGSPRFFVRMVHALFSSRRKTLSNNMKAVLPKEADADGVFLRAGIDKSLRAEALDVGQFMRLSREAYSAIMQGKGEQGNG